MINIEELKKWLKSDKAKQSGMDEYGEGWNDALDHVLGYVEIKEHVGKNDDD